MPCGESSTGIGSCRELSSRGFTRPGTGLVLSVFGACLGRLHAFTGSYQIEGSLSSHDESKNLLINVYYFQPI